MGEPAEEPIGWLVTGPAGEVVASGAPVVLEAASNAGEEET